MIVRGKNEERECGKVTGGLERGDGNIEIYRNGGSTDGRVKNSYLKREKAAPNSRQGKHSPAMLINMDG